MKHATKKQENRYQKCLTCNGKGEIMVKPGRIRSEACTWCNDGKEVVKCKACKGTGEFLTARTKNIVTCRKCNGTGTVTVKCQTCKGTGTIKYKTYPLYRDCDICKRAGNIAMFNPVISAASMEALMQLKKSL